VDCLLLRQPVKRVLKTALLGTCAPACRFEMLSLYKAERLSAKEVEAFRSRIERRLAKWPYELPSVFRLPTRRHYAANFRSC
jgi:hypothetical protein